MDIALEKRIYVFISFLIVLTFLIVNPSYAIECDYHETLDSYFFNTTLVFQEYVHFKTLELITPENETYSVDIVDKKVANEGGALKYIYYISVPDLYLKPGEQYVLNLSVSDLAGNIFSSIVCYSAPMIEFNIQLIKPKYNAAYQQAFPFTIKTSWPSSECRFSTAGANPDLFGSYPLLTKKDETRFEGTTIIPEESSDVTISVLCKDYHETNVFGPFSFNIIYLPDMPTLELSLTPRVTTNPDSVFTLSYDSDQDLLCKYDFRDKKFEEMKYNLSTYFMPSSTITFSLPESEKTKKEIGVYVKCINKAEREISKVLQLEIKDMEDIFITKPKNNCAIINRDVDLEFSVTTQSSCKVIYNNQTYSAYSSDSFDFTSSIYLSNSGTQELKIECNTMEGKKLTKSVTLNYIDTTQTISPKLDPPTCGGLIKGKYPVINPSITYETVFSRSYDINDLDSIISRVTGDQFSVNLNATPQVYLHHRYTISGCDGSFNSSWQYTLIDDAYFSECTDIFPPKLEFYINNTKVDLSTLSKMRFNPLDKIYFKIYDRDDPFKDYKEINPENYTLFGLSFCFEDLKNITTKYECPYDTPHDMTLNYISLYDFYRLGFLEAESKESCSFILNFTLLDPSGNTYNNATELHFDILNFSFEDTDNDGLPDDWEKKYFGDIDKYNATDDRDEDGLTNKEELKYETDPTDPDTDNDGINDGDEVHEYDTDPTDSDSDGDELDDGEEINTYKTDPLKEDSDNDGYTDGEEIECESDPLDKESFCEEKKEERETESNDKDDDGLPDDWEKKYFGDIDKYNGKDDPDDDGLTNEEELKYGTDPNNPDTDGDGINDGDEVHEYDTDPTLTDTDDDGYFDYEEVQCKADPNDPNNYCKKFNWTLAIIILILAAITGGCVIYVKKHPELLYKLTKAKAKSKGEETLPIIPSSIPPSPSSSPPLPISLNTPSLKTSEGKNKIIDDASLELLRRTASEPDEWDLEALNKIAENSKENSGFSFEELARNENEEDLSATDIEALQNLAKDSDTLLLVESLLPEVLEGELSREEIERRLDLLEKQGLIDSETRKQIEEHLKSRGLY